ncbi:MAG: radical SAM protein [Burkholderiales bacterium]|nr:radical SAM protein [Burkholderiales bacterium]
MSGDASMAGVQSLSARALSARDIADWVPVAAPPADPMRAARERMTRAGQWAPWQTIGRRMAIGCVALEITQRCNLDCTYCYLSESSEALKDIPLEEVYRRIDLIAEHYGAGTDVQVTGGEPTLRRQDELIAIVERVVQRGLRPSLFTNGIKLTRPLLEALSRVGLVDVAFHVDLTQERKGYPTEQSLNAVRLEYIALARGLPVAVMFNTTLFAGNIDELEMLGRFFISQHANIRMASFQLGADTGRGVDAPASAAEQIDKSRVIRGLQRAAGAPLNFTAVSAGHHACNRYGFALIAGGVAQDLFSDTRLAWDVLAATADARFDRRSKLRSLGAFAAAMLRRPGLMLRGAAWLVGALWRLKAGLLRSRGRIGKLSFFIHDFMDARALDGERCDACSFMVMTPEGPLSMCVHNAKRDTYLLQPARVASGETIRFWNPADGSWSAEPPARIAVSLTRKTARGRARNQVGKPIGKAA